MSLTFYNSLIRHKEPFEPLEPGKVKMYCCGVTVYDYCHLGHARSYIVWDTVRRYLQWRGFDVRYVQNFTDIDDKILKRAQQEGSSMQAVSEKFIQAYFEDMARLNIREADEYPRATYTLDGIKRLIHELEQKGIAYPAEGDVYYAVRKFPEYGKLSGRKLDDMQAGASGRVDTDPEALKKQDPSDFALWKAAKPGEPFWESPWGEGRPGWHIECSAMVQESFKSTDGKLADTIDIHVGGADLVFPHHENEIAQSEAATGHPLARYWLHNGMVNVGGEKMSKSLGNFTTIRDLLDAPNAPDAMAVRLFVLMAQYRKPIDFTDEAIASAQNAWNTLKEGLLFGYKYGQQLGYTDVNDSSFGNSEYMRIPDDSDAVKRFQTAMDDDINTAGAIAVLFELAKDLQKEGNRLSHEGKTTADPQTLRSHWQTLVVLAQVLGLEANPDELQPEKPSDVTDAEIGTMIQQRLEARKAKNWAESDRIRDDLKAKGIVLIDKPGGVTDWIRE
ncbi:cysteine--tRNA ligase [Oscillatoria sp. FACHB-1407]|uniref:cysteine--tRNA ligase n=1 Tax=Oscillatoria sp. FACHB-1407 TaxID=2692847 RepID=UPI001685BF87|nr:cysteine--tRNA ligase [Oscillatoria sp. FACHB-1407]MBD2465635.1 cysteine--tRNA ligase [Oscillatoria sp. FACHB-1407]